MRTLLVVAILITSTTSASAQDVPDVELAIKANDPAAMLQRVDPLTLRFVDVCQIPCSDVLSTPTGMYRVGGHGLTPTTPFPIVQGHANIIDAEVHSYSRVKLGAWLTGIGAAFVSASPWAFGAAALTDSAVNRNGFLGIGIPTAFVGVILVAAGAMLITTNQSRASHVITPRATQ